jgi:proteasome accessory factor C
MADYFSSPLRLTPAEALTLYAGASALSELPGMEDADALQRATTKLGRALGATSETDESQTIRVQVEAGPHEHLAKLERAVSNRKKIRLEYFSASRGALTERIVEPWGLIAALGRGYLVGWDDLTDDERMFRTDRIKHVVILDEDASIPDDFDPERYRGAWVARDVEPTIRLEISPRAARWFEDYYPVADAATTPDGWRSVELVSSGDVWAATLVLRLGADARAIEPESVVKQARDVAARVASRY